MSVRSGALAAAELSAEKEDEGCRRCEDHRHSTHPTEGLAASALLVQPPLKMFRKKGLHLRNKKARVFAGIKPTRLHRGLLKRLRKITNACAKPVSWMPTPCAGASLALPCATPRGLTQQTGQALGALTLATALSRPVRLRAAVLAAMLGVGGQGKGSGHCCPFGSGFACWRRCR